MFRFPLLNFSVFFDTLCLTQAIASFMEEINLLKRLQGKKTVVQYIDSEIDKQV